VSRLLRSKRRAQGWEEKDSVHVGEDLRSLSAYGSKFANVSFERCVMNLADFTGAPEIKDCSFDTCQMPLSSFRSATLDNVTFLDCDLEQANFAGVVLRNVQFVGCRLAYSIFAGATLRAVMFQNCNLHGADLDFIEAHEAIFRGSVLWGVKVGLSCPFFNASFDERSADYFAAILARVHPNKEKRRKMEEVAGTTAVGAVNRLMRSRDEDEAQAETDEAPQALRAV